MKIKVKITGIDQLIKEIDGVREEVRQALMEGTQDAANQFVAQARSNMITDTTSREALTTKMLPEKKGKPTAVALAGVDFYRSPKQHLIEFGTGPRYHKSGKYVGQMPASGEFRQTIDGAKPAVKEAIQRPVQKVIDKYKGKPGG